MEPKIALITGSARRVGATIAKTLHANNYNVVIHYRNSESEANALVDSLNQQRENSAKLLQAELSDVSNAPDLIKNVVEFWGGLDLLVNNASSFYPTHLCEVSEQNWDDLQNSNVKGAFFLSQAAYPYLRDREGSVINIIDIHAERPLRNYSAYCIAKAGLLMATQALAKEMAPQVRVNGVSPGAVMWPEGINALDPETKKMLLNKIPLEKHGTPEDIANTVLFLSQQEYITGEILKVDGGRQL